MNDRVTSWRDGPRRMGVRRHFPRRALALAVASCFAGGAQANPTGGAVVSGQASISQQGKTLTITNTPGAIINWQGFSVGRDEVTRFLQQGASSAVLNRVVGVNPSLILGTLQSNGRVFLINPNGIVVGPNAQIDVAGLVASTLNITDKDFAAGRMKFGDTPNAAALVNQGTISTPAGGQVVLLAPRVENSGIITSPKGEVILAAGRSVELVDVANPQLRVVIDAPANETVNLGKVVAEGGRVSLYGTVIRNSGELRANTAVRGENGEILLRAKKDVELTKESVITASGPTAGKITIEAEGGSAKVAGRIEANATEAAGGSVQVRAHADLTVQAQALITASGRSGGEVVLRAVSGTSLVSGTVEARGAGVAASLAAGAENADGSGNGGTIQVLGRNVGLIEAAVLDA